MGQTLAPLAIYGHGGVRFQSVAMLLVALSRCVCCKRGRYVLVVTECGHPRSKSAATSATSGPVTRPRWCLMDPTQARTCPRRGRPLLAANVARRVTALAAAEVEAASAHKRWSRGAAAAVPGRNLQNESDLARGGARPCCHQRSLHGVRRRRRHRGARSSAPVSRRDTRSTTSIILQQTQRFG